MKTIEALREERSVVAQSIKKILDDNKDKKWESSHQESYDALLLNIDAIDAQIVNIQSYLDRIAEEHISDHQQEQFNSSNKDKSARELYAKFLRGGDKAMSAEDWSNISNAMSTTTPSQGGYSVQSEVAQTLIEALKAYGGMRTVSTVISTEMGNPLSFPTTDGTAEEGEIVAENASATNADPSFGTVDLNPYKFSSKVVAVPIELLQDSQIDIESFINNRLVERLGRVTNRLFTTGTGTSQPRGAVVGSSSGKIGAAGQTSSIVLNDLIDIVHSVDVAYRSSASFMLNDSSMKVLRKISDSTGRPIFIPGYDGLGRSMPDSILGYSVTINNDMPAMSANAKSILFGDFSKYIIRDVMQATLFRFDDSAYAKLGQVGFLMWMRSGGNLTDTSAIKHYQNSAT